MKLTDEQKKSVPPANGRWDKAHKRVALRRPRRHRDARRAAARGSGSPGRPPVESSPRWAKNDTAVTYVRDGNLFLVPLDGGGLQQLTDVGPKKAEPRLTDSQKFIRDEEEKLLDAVKEQKDRKKKADEKDKAGQAAGARAPGSPDRDRPDALARRHARVRARRRAPGRRAQRDRPELRQRDRLHRGHSRAHGGRRRAEPRAARRFST